VVLPPRRSELDALCAGGRHALQDMIEHECRAGIGERAGEQDCHGQIDTLAQSGNGQEVQGNARSSGRITRQCCAPLWIDR
ncbi:MAG: hypothetical protein I4N50_12850, partial [Rhizobium sp.]|nr:hypothetical protein [Rhizobium sp.]